MAQVLNDFHYAVGSWPTDPAFLQQGMTWPDDNSLIAWLQQNKNNPGVTGPTSQAFPPSMVSALGDQVGAGAAYLNTDLAPIIIEAAAQGWDATHLTNAIQQTPYYQSHTATQLAWQTKSAADRSAAVGQLAVQIEGIYRQQFGTQAPQDPNTYAAIAQEVASGNETIEYVTMQVQQLAEKTPNTPAAQAVAALQKQAGQAGADIANTAQQLTQTWQQWVGTTYPPPQDIQQWAQGINMNTPGYTQAGFLQLAKTTANNLYPNKPSELDYTSWAQQPKSVLAGTWEQAAIPDTDLLLQSYLSPGSKIANLGDLKIAAQQDPRYDQTQQAKTQATQLGSQILSTWGFAGGSGL
jgi:hypothetical protein